MKVMFHFFTALIIRGEHDSIIESRTEEGTSLGSRICGIDFKFPKLENHFQRQVLDETWNLEFGSKFHLEFDMSFRIFLVLCFCAILSYPMRFDDECETHLLTTHKAKE